MAKRAATRGMGLRRPCKGCPFRSDVPRYLNPKRYQQIASELVEHGGSFLCHGTVAFDGTADCANTSEARACAGAMIWRQAQDRPNLLMQVMERLGAFDPAQLDRLAPVYRSREEFEIGCPEVVAHDSSR